MAVFGESDGQSDAPALLVLLKYFDDLQFPDNVERERPHETGVGADEQDLGARLNVELPNRGLDRGHGSQREDCKRDERKANGRGVGRVVEAGRLFCFVGL